MTNDTTHAAIGALKTWWAMLEAHWELSGETPPDDTVILLFMGSGASSTVTAGQLRAALASAAAPKAAPAPALSDSEIEALAVEHEAFGFGQVDARGLTTHGFDPGGLHSFVRALFARGQAPAPAAGNWVNAADVDRLTRELDVALNGEGGAAPQASLCDVVGQAKAEAAKLGRPLLAAPAAVADMPVKFTAAHVAYIDRHGGRCRDCADEGGVCPTRGLPCADGTKAIRFVLDALAYGINHGYISVPLASQVKGVKND